MNGTPDVPARLARRLAFRAGAVAGAATLLNAGLLGRAEAQPVADGAGAPRAGTWRPWLLTSGSQLRPPTPPDGVKIEVAMAILGHRNAAMLLEVYASALTEETPRAATQLQRYLYGPPAEK